MSQFEIELSRMLHQEADAVEMRGPLRPKARGRIRLRQTSLLVGVGATITAVFMTASSLFTFHGPSDQAASRIGGKGHVVGDGVIDGRPWVVAVRPSRPEDCALFLFDLEDLVRGFCRPFVPGNDPSVAVSMFRDEDLGRSVLVFRADVEAGIDIGILDSTGNFGLVDGMPLEVASDGTTFVDGDLVYRVFILPSLAARGTAISFSAGGDARILFSFDLGTGKFDYRKEGEPLRGESGRGVQGWADVEDGSDQVTIDCEVGKKSSRGSFHNVVCTVHPPSE